MSAPSDIHGRPAPPSENRPAAPGTGTARRLVAGLAGAGLLSITYMALEAQWVRCRQVDLPVPGLPAPWSGVTILHLSDVHAGTFATNDHSLAKVVRWAEPLRPDLVFLTGDIIGDPEQSQTCLRLLARLHPQLGMFAVTGNHEYGLSKAPLARSRATADVWREVGATLLSDSCVALPSRQGTSLMICGADYISGGFGLVADGAAPTGRGAVSNEGLLSEAAHATPASMIFSILLIHDPPGADSPLATVFPLAFSGHTHGGQLRIPSFHGLRPLHMTGRDYLEGVHPWGAGLLVVSRGIGTSFLPLRLLTRPEATLWRLRLV